MNHASQRRVRVPVKAFIAAAVVLVGAVLPMVVAHAADTYLVTVDGKQLNNPNGSTASCNIPPPSGPLHIVTLSITTNSSGFNPDYPISAEVRIVNGEMEEMNLAVPWMGQPGAQGNYKSTLIRMSGAGDSQVANTGNTYKVSGHAPERGSETMHAYEIDVTCP